MARIFLVLAIVAVSLLLVNLTIGLTKGDFGKSSAEFDDAKANYETLEGAADVTLERIAAARVGLRDAGKRMVAQRESFWIHIWLGIVAAMVNLLVHSISITYFIGTSRWCSEVVDAYELDPDLAAQSLRLKRRSFPWALVGILTTLAIASLGAAADPYNSTTSHPSTWVTAHWGLAMAGTVVIGAAFFSQVVAVGANYQVIGTILSHVEERRAALHAGRGESNDGEAGGGDHGDGDNRDGGNRDAKTGETGTAEEGVE